jgi:hypothetical protein
MSSVVVESQSYDSCPICGSVESSNVLLLEYRKGIALENGQTASQATGHCDAITLHHEAGHVVGARAFEAIVHYVTVIGNPHAAIVLARQGLLARLVISAAGDVAAAVCAGEQFIPLWSDLRRGVARARESKLGSCDRCVEARLLVSALPQLSDLEVVDVWYGIFEVTTDFFETVNWRRALEALAAELNDKKLIERDAIDKLIDRCSLVRARDEILSKYEGECS